MEFKERSKALAVWAGNSKAVLIKPEVDSSRRLLGLTTLKRGFNAVESIDSTPRVHPEGGRVETMRGCVY